MYEFPPLELDWVCNYSRNIHVSLGNIRAFTATGRIPISATSFGTKPSKETQTEVCFHSTKRAQRQLLNRIDGAVIQISSTYQFPFFTRRHSNDQRNFGLEWSVCISKQTDWKRLTGWTINTWYPPFFLPQQLRPSYWSPDSSKRHTDVLKSSW